METPETSTPGRRSSAALTECEQCHGVFSVMEMRALERRMYCRPCFQKSGGVDLVLGPPPPLPVAADDDAPAPGETPRSAPSAVFSQADAEAAQFAEYAALRQSLESAPDDFDRQRRCGEIASRLGLLLETVEHYRVCARLRPDDDEIALRLQNVELAARRAGLLVDTADPVTGAPGDAAVRADREARIAPEARAFWYEPMQVLGYPFQGRGPSLIAVAGLFFGVLNVIANVNVIGLAILACMAGYVGAYLFEVINSTAAGQRKPPDFPEPTSMLESYVFPLLSIVACLAVSYSPCIAATWMLIEGWLPAWLAALVIVVGAVCGTFVFPMTLMVKALFQDIAQVVKPALVFGSIGRILPDYVAAFIATCGIWIGYAIASAVLFLALMFTLGRPTPDALLEMDGIRIVSWVLHTLVSWPLLLYCVLLQGHLLGRVYRQGLRRLAWFVPPTAETVRAARLSVGLGIAGIAAALTLSGVLWVGYLIAERMAGTPTALAFLQESPLRPGARLTYYWEHTDGPRGLTIYEFEDAGEPLVHVVAHTEVTGDLTERYASIDVGTFDAGSGRLDTAAAPWELRGMLAQKPGEHFGLYGPRGATIGSPYINDWTVRGRERYRDTWDAWKVHDPNSTATLYYDSATGVYVGRRLVGVGYVVDEWLVDSTGPGVAPGPPANARFELLDAR